MKKTQAVYAMPSAVKHLENDNHPWGDNKRSALHRMPNEATHTMIIPHTDIGADTLYALIEEFVTRDGTDYGDIETSTATKVQQVMNQLNRKEVFIEYSEEYETCTIKTKDTLDIG